LGSSSCSARGNYRNVKEGCKTLIFENGVEG
jgi:hypothetical protein